MRPGRLADRSLRARASHAYVEPNDTDPREAEIIGSLKEFSPIARELCYC
jgi:hypothetical protein